MSRLAAAAARPVDAASVAVFRIGFGVLVAGSTVRFLWKGWVETLYLAPSHHLTYARFGWVRPLPAPLLYALMVALALLGVGIALGWRTRGCAMLFTVGFAYTELLDAALYLNHYWYVSLAGLLLVVLPTDRTLSVRRRGLGAAVPALVVWTLRAQLAVVYLFAGVAKLNADWLVHALPLRLWLADRTDVFVVGRLLDEPWVAVVASWFGAVFDCTIVAWLTWRRSRPFAYAVVVAFHLATAALFRIGVFPWVMIVSTLVFFPPAWPRRFLGRAAPATSPAPPPTGAPDRRHRAMLAALGVLAGLELALPLRHLAYPGDVRWTEEGYYLSWRVMLTEKAGFLEFEVHDPVAGSTWRVSPDSVLTPWQVAHATTRPELIVATAHLVGAVERLARGHDVEVRAVSFAAMNGRPARRLVDPTIDLSAVDRTASVRSVLAAPVP